MRRNLINKIATGISGALLAFLVSTSCINAAAGTKCAKSTESI